MTTNKSRKCILISQNGYPISINISSHTQINKLLKIKNMEKMNTIRLDYCMKYSEDIFQINYNNEFNSKNKTNELASFITQKNIKGDCLLIGKKDMSLEDFHWFIQFSIECINSIEVLKQIERKDFYSGNKYIVDKIKKSKNETKKLYSYEDEFIKPIKNFS